MVSYHNVQQWKETNDPILRKFSDRWTDGRTDRQTDRQTDTRTGRQTNENDFMGCCPNNVQCPLTLKSFKIVGQQNLRINM